jgi:hypothetical protein
MGGNSSRISCLAKGLELWRTKPGPLPRSWLIVASCTSRQASCQGNVLREPFLQVCLTDNKLRPVDPGGDWQPWVAPQGIDANLGWAQPSKMSHKKPCDENSCFCADMYNLYTYIMCVYIYTYWFVSNENIHTWFSSFIMYTYIYIHTYIYIYTCVRCRYGCR